MSLILFPLLSVINRYYHTGQYQRILRGYSILSSNKEKYSSYTNLHRVFSLFLTGDPRWQAEWMYMVDHGQLDILGEEDKTYLTIYLVHISKGKLHLQAANTSLDISKVSKRTRKYFPMDAETVQAKIQEQAKISKEQESKYFHIQL